MIVQKRSLHINVIVRTQASVFKKHVIKTESKEERGKAREEMNLLVN